MRLLVAENVETSGFCALKMMLRGGNNTENERKLDSFGLPACFTNVASWTDALPERVWDFYW